MTIMALHPAAKHTPRPIIPRCCCFSSPGNVRGGSLPTIRSIQYSATRAQRGRVREYSRPDPCIDAALPVRPLFHHTVYRVARARVRPSPDALMGRVTTASCLRRARKLTSCAHRGVRAALQRPPSNQQRCTIVWPVSSRYLHEQKSRTKPHQPEGDEQDRLFLRMCKELAVSPVVGHDPVHIYFT